MKEEVPTASEVRKETDKLISAETANAIKDLVESIREDYHEKKMEGTFDIPYELGEKLVKEIKELLEPLGFSIEEKLEGIWNNDPSLNNFIIINWKGVK